MGLVKLPSTRSCWETYMSYDGVSSVLSRNRFNTILSNMHFVDNLTLPKEAKDADRAWKIYPWIPRFWENFLKVSPEEFQSVDEIMVGFKGSSLLRQYMPNKPRKWRFKLWGRSGIGSYLYNFYIYQENEVKRSSKPTTYGVGESVAIKMCSTLPSGHIFKVFADSYFRTFRLMEILKRRQIWFAGTVRINRLKNIHLLCKKDSWKGGRGSFDYRTDKSTNNTAIRWYDNKTVH